MNSCSPHLNGAMPELPDPPLSQSKARQTRLDPPGTVVLFAPPSPASPAVQPSQAPLANHRASKRLRNFLVRLVERIDLRDFPRSCCGGKPVELTISNGGRLLNEADTPSDSSLPPGS